MGVFNSYMINGKGKSMDKVRRVERMVAMTKLLVDSPQKLIPLNYFCDFFGMAKSTVSEDLTCVRQSMEHFQLGTLETVAGVAGGVRFIPHRKGSQANDILKYSARGLGLSEIEKKLNCSAAVIKDRIKRAKKELNLRTFSELLDVYKEKGRVPIGDKFFVLRSEETKKLKKYVDKNGFYNLFMKNPLMEYMIDDKIFKKEKHPSLRP